MKFAAIDIGSNAIRLLFTTVYNTDKEPVFKKIALYRFPLRLGTEVFSSGSISAAGIESLTLALCGFKKLIEAHRVIAYRVCATSAMREAKNSEEVIAVVQKKCGLTIEIIDGNEEAKIIYKNQIKSLLTTDATVLYVDVGGGSTELTIFADNKPQDSVSFNIGTVRLLEKKVDKTTWDEAKNWVKNSTKTHKPEYIIGSGGNINKLYKLAITKKKKEFSISKTQLNLIAKKLKKLTYEERITKLGLNPDRADVIVPAAEVFLSILDWSSCSKVIVPKIGLADGIIKELYEKEKNAT